MVSSVFITKANFLAQNKWRRQSSSESLMVWRGRFHPSSPAPLAREPPGVRCTATAKVLHPPFRELNIIRGVLKRAKRWHLVGAQAVEIQANGAKRKTYFFSSAV